MEYNNHKIQYIFHIIYYSQLILFTLIFIAKKILSHLESCRVRTEPRFIPGLYG